MRTYQVEQSTDAWRVVRAGQAVLARADERAARRAAAVLNEWALVEDALRLDAPAGRVGSALRYFQVREQALSLAEAGTAA